MIYGGVYKIINIGSMFTHIFIFFFGPGFPLGFGMASAANCDAVRFIPGFGPGMPLRFVGLAGGTSRLLFGVDAAALGVESTAELAGEDTDSSDFSWGNFLRALCESLRVTSIDLVCLDGETFDA